jgi:YaaC-like Protein
VMRGAINARVPVAQQPEALAFLEQAADFYSAASTRLAANPLLLYYSFLNLGKALLRVLGFTGSLDRAMHGLTERTTSGGIELTDSEVVVKDQGQIVNVFAQLVDQLGFARPLDGTAYPVVDLLPQVVVGHRLWREAHVVNKERFVALSEIEIVHDKAAKDLWLRLYLDRGDLARYEITRRRLLDEGDLNGAFREVKIRGTGRLDPLICLEQTGNVSYTGRPTDVVLDLVDFVRSRLWRIVSSVPGSGYRRYYLHLTPPGDSSRVPQLASLWALFYYFGSVVRYRPHLFDSITSDAYGAFVTEFISAQAEQFLYLLASEVCEREVAKPAIV